MALLGVLDALRTPTAARTRRRTKPVGDSTRFDAVARFDARAAAVWIRTDPAGKNWRGRCSATRRRRSWRPRWTIRAPVPAGSRFGVPGSTSTSGRAALASRRRRASRARGRRRARRSSRRRGTPRGEPVRASFRQSRSGRRPRRFVSRVRDARLAEFFSRDFAEARHREAALKNVRAALQAQVLFAATFFALADNPRTRRRWCGNTEGISRWR